MASIITGQQIPYAVVPVALIRDPYITPEAKGIYAYMLSYATIPEWQLLPTKIKKDNNIGDKRYIRIMQELKTAGYVVYHIRPILPRGWNNSIEVLCVARTDGVNTLYYDIRGIPTGKTNLTHSTSDNDDDGWYLDG